MATINTMVKLDTASSVAGVLSLDFTNSKQYAVSDVTGDDLSLSAETEIVAADYGVTAYVYMVNTSAAAQVKLYDVTVGTEWGVIEPGEWAFFAVPNGRGLKITPSTGTITVNYVLMKKLG